MINPKRCRYQLTFFFLSTKKEEIRYKLLLFLNIKLIYCYKDDSTLCIWVLFCCFKNNYIKRLLQYLNKHMSQ